VSGYTGLHFRFSALRAEIASLSKLAKPFIDVSCQYLLDSWSSDLQSIESTNSTATSSWRISESTPIRTRTTREYEPAGREGGHDVWGELTFIWKVNRVSTNNRATKGHMCLSGNASTKIKICETVDGNPKVLAQWQIEVGAADSPGWHFHVGLCGEADEAPFPHWLPVPRVPGVLILPTDGLDFLLGELFQVQWRESVLKDSYETQQLGTAQLDRIKKFCSWQSGQVDSGHGSRWNRLKHCKPPADLFLV